MCIQVRLCFGTADFMTYRDLVRNHCWLVNHAGKRDSFVPTDQAQEQNIRDIKVGCSESTRVMLTGDR